MQIYKRNALLSALLIIGISFTAWGARFFGKADKVSSERVGLQTAGIDDMAKQTVIARLKISFNSEEVLVSLFESDASRQLLAQLPLTLSFSDFAKAEKIAYLPSRLSTRNTPAARDVIADFTYYEPWGNLAIFYKGSNNGAWLYVLGRIDSGKDKLAAMQQDFTATIEKVE